MACDAFYVTVLKNLRFHLSTIETKRFQKSPRLKPFLKVAVFIGVFGRFSVDNGRKRIKKYAFSDFLEKTGQFFCSCNQLPSFPSAAKHN